MKQQFVTKEVIHLSSEKWHITFNALNTNCTILHVTNDDKFIIDIKITDGEITASILFSGRETPLTLKGKVHERDLVIINNAHYKISLYVNGILCDEDWPIGTVQLKNAICEKLGTSVFISDEEFCENQEKADTIRTFHNVQGWKPEGLNTHVGDCMPLYHDGTYHLFYLFDRRGHGSKWGLGAHQWGHISSNDLVNWNEHPLAVKIDRQEEGSICTGSVVVHNGIFYAFYAVRMCDGSPAKLSWSTSSDGIHFTKSHQDFALSAPYHPASARDQKVFADSDGVFHMLITTSLVTETGNKGCLAHVVSRDLINWEQAKPMVILDIEDQPECSDYFYKKGFYYLIYSNFGVAHYFISKEPFGPWEAPKNNVIVDETYRVPKRALWKDERIIFAGFNIGNDVHWGGTARFYEAKQQADGTLEFVDVPEMCDLT